MSQATLYKKGDQIEVIVEPINRANGARTITKIVKITKPTTREEACTMCRREGNKVVDNLKKTTGEDYWWYEGETTWKR